MSKKRLEKKFIFVILLIVLFLPAVESNSTITGLIVGSENIAPILVTHIPNQTWAANTNLTEVFDLADYFFDNETLTFGKTSPTNITIVINETNISNTTEFLVSFYPDQGFSGVRIVTFNASDGGLTTDSNLVYLNVTPDTTPPLWSNPRKDETNVTQNEIVEFSVDWTDDLGLSHFFLAMDQGFGWFNFSNNSMTGLSNTSSYSTKISAPGGSTVSWQVFGFDASNNQNKTEVYNFTVDALPSSGGGSGSDGADEEDENDTGVSYGEAPDPAEFEEVLNFTIFPDEESFKLDVKQGGTATIIIKVTNTGNIVQDFNIWIDALEVFGITYSDQEFNLSAGESKTVTIDFKAPKDLSPDIYFGDLKIQSNSGRKSIPVAIVVNAIRTEFEIEVNISETYKLVNPGRIVSADITLRNLLDIEQENLMLYFAMLDYEGNTYDSMQEQMNFSERELTFKRNLTVPQKIKAGEYIFLGRASNANNFTIDTDTFEAGERFDIASFIRGGSMLIFLLLISSIITIFMIRRHKNKERMRLLNLYMMVSELRKLIKAGEIDRAIDVYIRLKSIHGEPVAPTALQNKEKLREEMVKLSEKLKATVPDKHEEDNVKEKEPENKDKEKNANKDSKKDNEEKTKEDPKETQEKEKSNAEEKQKEDIKPESSQENKSEKKDK